MVRLKAIVPFVSGLLFSVFTFQYGSIKSSICVKAIALSLDLHSNMVRLKEISIKNSIALYIDLHSNMVRLKAERIESRFN